MKKGKNKRIPAKKSKKNNKKNGRLQPKTTAQSSVGLTPLGDKVIVRPLSDEEATRVLPSGIVIPQTVSEEKLDRGLVVAVGEGRLDENGKRVPLSVSVGDKVIFQWGDKIEINREKYMVVSEGSILAILK